MKRDKKFWIYVLIFAAITGTIFAVGIFNNPDFDIHDFCMGLSTEIVGVLIVVLVIDRYSALRIERRERYKAEGKDNKWHFLR